MTRGRHIMRKIRGDKPSTSSSFPLECGELVMFGLVTWWMDAGDFVRGAANYWRCH